MNKQIESLSRINHKNFINLLGFCEEEEPFTRVMVFEYAPNGTLYENLHGKYYVKVILIVAMRNTIFFLHIQVITCW